MIEPPDSSLAPRPPLRRLTLAIEASNPSAGGPGASSCGVAIGGVSEVGAVVTLGSEAVATAERHADDLTPAIDRLTRRLGVNPGDLARVAVSLGPGGYTSLRMAVATAAMIAEATGAECVGVGSDSVVAARVRSTSPFAVLLASKQDRAWVRFYSASGSPLGEGAILDAGAFGDACTSCRAGVVVADRFLPAAFEAVAAALGLDRRQPAFDPQACLEASLPTPPIPPIMLAPVYGREPEAVRQWRIQRGPTA